MRSLAGSLLWRGLLAVVVGIIAIAWPGVTILAVVIIFAIAAFGASIGQAVRAFSSNGFGPVIGHLLLSLLDVAAGLVAVLWPGITAFALTIWIGIWAVVSGFGEFVMAFAYGETGGQRFLFGLTGLVTIALGIVLFAPRCRRGCTGRGLRALQPGNGYRQPRASRTSPPRRQAAFPYGELRRGRAGRRGRTRR